MALLIENCTVKAGKRTILSLERAEFPQCAVSAVIGPNGAGKSTLLKQFLYHPQASWCGAPMKDALRQHKIAWVGQHEHFNLPMTLSEYVLIGRYPQLAWYRRPKQADTRRAQTLLEHFDLADLQHKRIQTLSGGEQQRAALIRALLQDAEVLFLDEPTNHLDVRYQHSLMQHLTTLPEQGMTVVMVLHDLNLAAHYATHITLMKNGNITAAGATADIMHAERLSQTYDWRILECTANGKTWFQAETL